MSSAVPGFEAMIVSPSLAMVILRGGLQHWQSSISSGVTIAEMEFLRSIGVCERRISKRKNGCIVTEFRLIKEMGTTDRVIIPMQGKPPIDEFKRNYARSDIVVRGDENTPVVRVIFTDETDMITFKLICNAI